MKNYTTKELTEESNKKIDDFAEALLKGMITNSKRGCSFDLESLKDKTKFEENEKNTGGINIKYNTHTGELEFNIDPKDLAVIFSTLKELQDLMKKP